jgi:hypothetical protein
MDGQDALIGCVFRENYQRSLGNIVGGWERIGQSQEKAGILCEDSKLDLVREDTLVLNRVIVLFIRIGSVREIRIRIEKDFEIVDGLHVRRTDMVGATAGSDDQCDLLVRDRLVGYKMHGGSRRGALYSSMFVFSIF